MTSASQVFTEVDQLRGRISAIYVNYPDTQHRLDESIKLLDQLLTKPVPGLLSMVIEDLYDLRSYFNDIIAHFPETRRQIQPAVDLVSLLLGPDGGNT